MALRTNVLLGLIFCCLLPAGCGRVGLINRYTAREEVRKTFTVQSAPTITVETFNDPIDILTGTTDTVEIKVTKRAGGPSQEEAEDDLANIDVKFEQTDNKIRVSTTNVNSKTFSDRGASVEITVPEDTKLDLQTMNGKVSIVGLVGNTEVRTSNGAVEAKGCRGELRLQTSNGPINVEGGSGRIGARTSNGAIDITSSKSVINAETSNGKIVFTGGLPEGKHIMRTSNGNIKLKLPATVTFLLNANTTNGRIDIDFAKYGPAERKAKKTAKTTHLAGAYAESPVATLDLLSSNGNIDIKRE